MNYHLVWVVAHQLTRWDELSARVHWPIFNHPKVIPHHRPKSTTSKELRGHLLSTSHFLALSVRIFNRF